MDLEQLPPESLSKPIGHGILASQRREVPMGGSSPGLLQLEKPVFTPRHLMFGDIAFNQVYHLAKDRVIGRHILRLYQKYHIRSGFVTIIICNLWRIDRSLCSPDVETFLWDFESGSTHARFPLQCRS